MKIFFLFLCTDRVFAPICAEPRRIGFLETKFALMSSNAQMERMRRKSIPLLQACADRFHQMLNIAGMSEVVDSLTQLLISYCAEKSATE